MKSAVMLGLAIGDALGRPFEFSNTKAILASGWQGNYAGGALWNLQPGQWTDDTKMALCIADSLVENKKFSPDDISKRYVGWVESGDLRGIGTRCDESIQRLKSGVHYLESGKKIKPDAAPAIKRVGDSSFEDFVGNGTVMRVAPIGVAFRKDRVALKEAAHGDANITHNHPDARDASLALATIIAEVLEGAEPTDAIFSAMDLQFEYDHVPNMMLKAVQLAAVSNPIKALQELPSRGTAHETLGSAVYAIISSEENFHSSLVASIIMGGDTDTRAAIVGAILGARGKDGINKDLIDGLEDSKRIQKLDQQLMKVFK